MKSSKNGVIAVVSLSVLMTACLSTPVKVANKKTYQVGKETLEFGGTFSPDDNELVILINGDPHMKGSFPPYTPTQNFDVKYKNIPIDVHCYFGSVLSSKKSLVGVVSGVIQAKKGKSADKCEIKVNNKMAETLYF